MKNFKIKKYLITGFILVILIALGFVLDRFFPVKPTQADATDNVSGWSPLRRPADEAGLGQRLLASHLLRICFSTDRA